MVWLKLVVRFFYKRNYFQHPFQTSRVDLVGQEYGRAVYSAAEVDADALDQTLEL